jgi:hypothetical protein
MQSCYRDFFGKITQIKIEVHADDLWLRSLSLDLKLNSTYESPLPTSAMASV